MLWKYKYRPEIIEDICGNNDVIFKLKETISHSHNVIVYGNHGIGKNLTIKCILNELEAKSEDIYRINACSDRGIKTIRGALATFLKFKTEGKKYVIIEDIINLSHGSQHGLCSIMEKFNNACFIFCTNNYQYVIESIQSRCYFFPLQTIQKDELKQYAISILKKENILFDNEIFDILYDFTKGDVRRYIINLQSASLGTKHIKTEDLFKVIKKPFSNTMEKIVEYTQKNDRLVCMEEINLLLNQGYNHGDIIKYLFDFCLECDLEQDIKLKYLDCIGQAQITNARGLYSNIQLDNLMIELCQLT